MVSYERDEKRSPEAIHAAATDERSLWETLEVGDEGVVDLLTKMRPRWNSVRGVLDIQTIDGIPPSMETIVGVFLFVWALRKFAESRWITVGRVSRRLVASWITGFGGFAAELWRRTDVHKWYLNGSENPGKPRSSSPW